MPLRAMSRTTSLQDGLSEAADSTTACAAIKRSFEAPCTDDYVDYDDLSDSSDDSNYARLDGNTTTRRGQCKQFVLSISPLLIETRYNSFSPSDAMIEIKY